MSDRGHAVFHRRVKKEVQLTYCTYTIAYKKNVRE